MEEPPTDKIHSPTHPRTSRLLGCICLLKEREIIYLMIVHHPSFLLSLASGLLLFTILAESFLPPAGQRRPQRSQKRHDTVLAFSKDDEGPDPLTKASWYAVEAFGKAFGKRKGPDSNVREPGPPTSLPETLRRIQEDNDREYFLSGKVDILIYDEDCVFADPFVSFSGRDRFVDNLANLGSFITAYSAKPLDYKVEGNAVETKFMVKLQLNLPWKPVLAWPWGVRCEINPDTCLVELHKESWDIDAWEVSLDR